MLITPEVKVGLTSVPDHLKRIEKELGEKVILEIFNTSVFQKAWKIFRGFFYWEISFSLIFLQRF